MKFNKHEPHDQTEQNTFRRLSNKVKQYLQRMYESRKCKSMSHGAYDKLRSMSWAHNENWRRNSQRSLNKQHKK